MVDFLNPSKYLINYISNLAVLKMQIKVKMWNISEHMFYFIEDEVISDMMKLVIEQYLLHWGRHGC